MNSLYFYRIVFDQIEDFKTMTNVSSLHLFEKKRTYTYIDNKVKISMILKVTVLLFWVSKMKKTIFRNHSCTFWFVQIVIINTPDCRYIFTDYLIKWFIRKQLQCWLNITMANEAFNTFKTYWNIGSKNGEWNHANKTRVVLSH